MITEKLVALINIYRIKVCMLKINPFTPTSAYTKTALIAQGVQVSCSLLRDKLEVHHKTCKLLKNEAISCLAVQTKFILQRQIFLFIVNSMSKEFKEL